MQRNEKALVCIMTEKGRIIKKIISEIDWYIIEKVRELRKSKFSQIALSIEIGFAEGFIGRIESPNYSATYSPRHINLIAKALKVKVSDIMPSQPLKNDLILLVIKIKSATKLKTGEKNYEVIEEIPLTDEEVEEYNKSVLHRSSKNKQSAKPKKKKTDIKKLKK